MRFAWNKTHEGQSLAKDISKFAKKQKVQISANDLSMPTKINKEQQKILVDFWKKNGVWASKKLSIALEKAYKEVQISADLVNGDSISGVKISYNTFPTKAQNNILKWAKSKGYDVDKLRIGLAVMYYNEVKPNAKDFEIERKTTNIVRKYESVFPESADKVATCLHYNLLHLYKALEEQTPEILRAFDNNIGKLNAMKFAFRAANSKLTQPIFADTPYGITPIPGTDMDDILSMYNSLMMQALLQDSLGFSTYMDKKLDEIYAEFERLEIPTSKPN